jgi:hypothetical protein
MTNNGDMADVEYVFDAEGYIKEISGILLNQNRLSSQYHFYESSLVKYQYVQLLHFYFYPSLLLQYTTIQYMT